MKAYISFVISTILLIMSGIIADISNMPDKNDNILMDVLNNKRCFISESGQSMFLKDYMSNGYDNGVPFETEVIDYTFVDFDADSRNEIVAYIKTDPRPNYVWTIVLHYDGQDVWGFGFGVRELHDLKTDGSFISTAGAGTHFYCRLSFENNQRNVSYIAIKDDMEKIYEINGETCTVEEVDKYISEWTLSEPVQWMSFNLDNK